MGLLIVVGLFAVRGFQYPSWYSMGGYYNANGDIENSLGHNDVAEAYYVNGNTYAYHNHKSNYNLAMMLQEDNPSEALKHYEYSLDQQPTAQAVINKANLENNRGELYKALFTLQEGNRILPDNPNIQNNLARQFEKVKIIDSADYYYAKTGPVTRELKNNRLALAAQQGTSLGKDSLAWVEDLNRAGAANAAALGYFDSQPDMSSANHMFDMVYLNNWLVQDEEDIAPELLTSVKQAIDSTSNADYRDQLLYSWSLASYRVGQMSKAVDGLSGLMFNSVDWSDKAKIALGRMYLDLGSYDQAITLLTEANKGDINLDLAVAYLEYGEPEKVFDFWQMAAAREEGFLAEIARKIIKVVYGHQRIGALEGLKRRIFK
jgi:tetratricopeptide (TPR) repeat protein